MTVFNTIAKIGRRFASELEGLIIGLLEQSNISNNAKIEAQVVNKGRWNTVNKLKRRKIGELQGLKMSIVQESFREYNSNIDMKNTAFDVSNNNDISKLERRKYGELDGLLINIIENSFRRTKVYLNRFRFVKPMKTYKNKIKLLFKYSNKTKY